MGRVIKTPTQVRYDNPLKQGLKLPPVAVTEGGSKVRYDNPLKQGLKQLRRLVIVGDLFVRYDNPLKQGLKRSTGIDPANVRMSDMTIH